MVMTITERMYEVKTARIVSTSVVEMGESGFESVEELQQTLLSRYSDSKTQRALRIEGGIKLAELGSYMGFRNVQEIRLS